MSYLSDCHPLEAKRVLEKFEQTQKVMEHAKDLRSTYRKHNDGYTKDRSMRHILSFHPSVMFHPEFCKYFDKEMDAQERKKHLYDFARKYPEYVVVDKL